MCKFEEGNPVVAQAVAGAAVECWCERFQGQPHLQHIRLEALNIHLEQVNVQVTKHLGAEGLWGRGGRQRS